MFKWSMQGHFRYLRFKTFPMTPRTPQCKVFWAFLLNPKHSGVPEDSKSPTLGVLGFTPTLGQSGVATLLVPRVAWWVFLFHIVVLFIFFILFLFFKKNLAKVFSVLKVLWLKSSCTKRMTKLFLVSSAVQIMYIPPNYSWHRGYFKDIL